MTLSKKIEDTWNDYKKALPLFCLLLSIPTLLSLLSERFYVCELLTHFKTQYLLAAIILAISGAIARNLKVVFYSIIIFAVNLITMMPYIFTESSAGNIKNAGLSFISANVLSSNQNYDFLKPIISSSQAPDVILLLEVNKDWSDNLDYLSDQYPHQIKNPRADNFGMSLYSRIPIKGEVKYYDAEGFFFPYIIANIEEYEIKFIGVHPPPPSRARYAEMRNENISRVENKVTSEPNGKFIIMGDFNDTLWSSHMKNFLKTTGLKPTANGIRSTWPTFWGIFGVQIDHALIKNIDNYKFEVLPSMGSDHYPISLAVK